MQPFKVFLQTYNYIVIYMFLNKVIYSQIFSLFKYWLESIHTFVLVMLLLKLINTSSESMIATVFFKKHSLLFLFIFSQIIINYHYTYRYLLFSWHKFSAVSSIFLFVHPKHQSFPLSPKSKHRNLNYK